MKFHPSIAAQTLQTPLGPLNLAVTDVGLAGAWFEGQKHDLHDKSWPCPSKNKTSLLSKIEQWFADYFNTDKVCPHVPTDIPLDLSGGTAFQQQVWKALVAIAPGRSMSYGDLAAHLGKPSAARAVGAAVGRNPISVWVPCHRVVGSSGALTGYAGGLDRKHALLQREGYLL
jgi:methylated-DNA-[protein]-cysteine S-methyltransferase